MSAIVSQMSSLSIRAPASGKAQMVAAETPALKSFNGFKAMATPVNALKTVRLQGVARRIGLNIQAARVAGVEIPNAKRVQTALTYIYGVGPKIASDIMETTGLENKRTGELEEEELKLLRDQVDLVMVEGDLRRFNELNIKRLKDIGCYRGRRHIASLPLRGQKTKTNARTRKGKKVAIAGKKKAPTAR